MKIKEAIARFDTLYPNAFSHSDKISWLSELDGKIFSEIISLYENAPPYFTGYTSSASDSTELLVPFPDDDIYIKFMCLKTDLINSDIRRFNNSAMLFNSAFTSLANTYNRTHTYKQKNRITFGGDNNAASCPLCS